MLGMVARRIMESMYLLHLLQILLALLPVPLMKLTLMTGPACVDFGC